MVCIIDPVRAISEFCVKYDTILGLLSMLLFYLFPACTFTCHQEMLMWVNSEFLSVGFTIQFYEV